MKIQNPDVPERATFSIGNTHGEFQKLTRLQKYLSTLGSSEDKSTILRIGYTAYRDKYQHILTLDRAGETEKGRDEGRDGPYHLILKDPHPHPHPHPHLGVCLQ